MASNLSCNMQISQMKKCQLEMPTKAFTTELYFSECFKEMKVSYFVNNKN